MARKRLKKTPSKEQNKSKLGLYLITLGILIFLLGSFTHAQIYYNYLITQKEKPKPIQHITQIPVSLKIPTQLIDVKVDQGGIVDGNWVLSDSRALYLPTSGYLGEGYNTIIYAHNTKVLFGGLAFIQPGEMIILKDKAGKEYKYKVISREDIDPTDLRKLYSTEKNILTLFTCDGWFDQSRLLVRAKLQ